MTLEDLTNLDIITQVARLLYELHHVDIKALELVDRKGRPVVYKKAFLTLKETADSVANIPDKLSDDSKDAKYQQLRGGLSNDFLNEELEFVQNIIDDIAFPLTFTHMDLHPRNMVINEETGKISFIDLESSCFTYECHDMNRLFMNWQIYKVVGFRGRDEPDLTDDTRRQFLYAYLRARYDHLNRHDHVISAEELELYDVQDRIIEIVMWLQFMILDLGNIDSAIDLDFCKCVNHWKEQYFLKKCELPGLKERYFQLLSDV